MSIGTGAARKEAIMDYRRILVVGDIHGQYEKLKSLYEKLEFNQQEDLLIFLRDYVVTKCMMTEIMRRP